MKKPLRKDAGLGADLGDATASKLAAMKPGDSMDILQRTDPPVQTQTADQLGERPTQSWPLGIGAGRAEPGIPVYVTKLENELQPVPGYGRTSPGLAATTVRGDSWAIGSDFRVVGVDEGGTFSAADKPVDRGTLPTPSPLITDWTSGGPIPVDAGRDTNTKRPTSHKHPGEEGDAL